MGSNDTFKRGKEQRRKRTIGTIEKRKTTWLVVTEGTKTEPNYLKGLEKHLNKNGGNKIELDIRGTGRNTVSLVDHVDNCFDYTDKFIGSKKIPYEKVCVIFDKDSFSDNNFNRAINKANGRGYISCWSNESFELWILLHFEDMTVQIGRTECLNKVKKIFLEKCGRKYLKNDPDIFDIVNNFGSVSDAVKRAEKLDKLYKDRKYAKQNPNTHMYKIVKMLYKETGCKFKIY